MIGVQEEDFFGKCETCPATGLKDTCHKSNHPKERLCGRFVLCHPSLIEAPPLFYSQDGTTEEHSCYKVNCVYIEVFAMCIKKAPLVR
jgi:hypothetical protein